MKGNKMRKEYKFRNFILDVIGVVLTGGLWFIWILAREMRNIANSRRY
jgi:hypothetical protein